MDIDIIFAFINFVGWVKGGGEAGGRMIIPVTKNEFQVKSCTAQATRMSTYLSCEAFGFATYLSFRDGAN